jgi:adenine-specific DNA-methyltransferase
MKTANHLTDKVKIVEALKAFASGSLASNAIHLFDTLGYRSSKTLQLEPNTVSGLLELANLSDFLNPSKAHAEDWKSVDFLFQTTDEEIRNLADGSLNFDSKADPHSDKQIESYIFLAIELRQDFYSRAMLADITREINRLFPMPSLVLFKHGPTLTLSVIDRRLHKRDQARDVLLRVTLIKDIIFADPIRAHIDILHDLSLSALQDEFHFHSFVGLHLALKKRLDTDALNKKFYVDLANWYFWALSHEDVIYPRSVETEEEHSIFLIRLLTRLIFCWFLQEKGLIPRDIFRWRYMEGMLKDSSLSSGTYYRAVLQNLFFATLNQEMDRRGFRKKNSGGRDGNRGATNLYRYADHLNDTAAFEQVLQEIPFVNGGLFDCLDDTQVEPNIRLDDFSEERKNRIKLPNELFFGEDREVDLAEAYRDTSRRHEHARGLIDLLSRYKFTVEESTPLEQEVALDPELLGRVFENLLASYNEDTSTTARKATGSFYTPREIVSYLVDEALISYFSSVIKESEVGKDDAEARLRSLFSDSADDASGAFSLEEVVILLAAIDRVQILDPACGSGAFLMGALHRLVDLLKRLDPENKHWRALQRRRAVEETDETFKLGDKDDRSRRLDDINEVFERNTSDYGRKLYLIENCIYGVDIQPIAGQIAKLRFFISLIVDQGVDPREVNMGVRPLPNLEAKVVAADALVPIERPQHHQFDLLDAQVSPLRQELAEVRHKYFLARTPTTKAKCRKRDGELRREIARLLGGSGWNSATAQKMASWDPYDQNVHATFFDPEWMFGLPFGKVRLIERAGAGLRGNFAFINEALGRTETLEPKEIEGGFDVIIGNPPYIRLQTLKQKNPKQVEFFRTHYESARKGNYDIYVVFVERGMQLLRPTGNLAYILPHKFFNAQYGESLRGLIARGRNLRHVVHFSDQQVFPGATNYVCLLFLSKAGSQFLRFVKVDKLEDWLKNRIGSAVDIPADKVTAAEWNFAVGKGSRVLEHLEGIESRLSDVTDRIYQGPITSADSVFLFKQYKDGTGAICEVFSKELEEWVQIENTLLKPVVRSGDIGPYHAHVEARVLFPYEVRGVEARLYSPSEMKQRFPLAWRYLNGNRPLLEQREQGKFADAQWYRFGRTQNLGAWEQPKLMIPYMITTLSAYLDEREHLYFINVTTGGYGITAEKKGGDLKFLCGLLNSPVLDYFFKHVSTSFHGGYFAANKQFIAQLPIPLAQDNQKALISVLVDYLLWLHRQPKRVGKDANETRHALMLGYFTQLVNGLVYELFFPNELHEVGLRPFDVASKQHFKTLDEIPESNRISILREVFEQLYDTNHALRGCLHDLGSLETVRIIEGRE